VEAFGFALPECVGCDRCGVVYEGREYKPDLSFKPTGRTIFAWDGDVWLCKRCHHQKQFRPRGVPSRGALSPAQPRVLVTRLGHREIALVKKHLPGALVPGGRSRGIRGSDRENTRSEDNFVGQLGECAGSILVTGDTKGYERHRAQQEKNTSVSSGPSDLDTHNVDFKVSKWRYHHDDPLRHHLYVRQRERHPGLYYVLGLARWGEDSAEVHWLGWCHESSLPNDPDADGRFACPALSLRFDYDGLRRSSAKLRGRA
jgi:rubredoxin